MIESPKKRFLKTSDAKRLWDIVGDPAVIAGLDAAMLQLQLEMASNFTENRDVACDLHHQMVGAKKFRDKFLTISEADKPSTKTQSYTLPE